METLTEYTPTELLHEINIVKASHERLKNDVIELTQVIDETTILINNKLDFIRDLEKRYIELIDEMNDRNLIE